MNEEKKPNQRIFQKPWFQSLAAIVIIFGALAGFIYWQSIRNTVLIENSYLDAPVVNITPSTSGILNALYVKEGDRVSVNTPVALVGSETLYSKGEGIISKAPKVLGAYINTFLGDSAVSVIDDKQMRVVGAIDENKGLDEIKPGQRATFTVDAFPGTTYEGVVDEIGADSNDSSVVFSISDKRPTKNFNVYVKFDTSKYPELKSGMSAKITVHTK